MNVLKGETDKCQQRDVVSRLFVCYYIHTYVYKRANTYIHTHESTFTFVLFSRKKLIGHFKSLLSMNNVFIAFVYSTNLFFLFRNMTNTPDIGVADMTSIPEIDENGINSNLKLRYTNDIIYVSFQNFHFTLSFYSKI